MRAATPCTVSVCPNDPDLVVILGVPSGVGSRVGFGVGVGLGFAVGFVVESVVGAAVGTGVADSTTASGGAPVGLDLGGNDTTNGSAVEEGDAPAPARRAMTAMRMDPGPVPESPYRARSHI
jgi:hypothetical protein